MAKEKQENKENKEIKRIIRNAGTVKLKTDPNCSGTVTTYKPICDVKDISTEKLMFCGIRNGQPVLRQDLSINDIDFT